MSNANALKRNELYPWLLPIWDRITASKLAHAILLEGHEGVAPSQLAQTLAKWQLCIDPVEDGACGHCQSCLLDAAQGGHPDAVWVMPPAAGKQIGIQVIRELQDFANTKPQLAKNKVVVMGPAENLNHNAMNAVLKTLEEPIPNFYFFLWSHQPGKLLPTFVSRCQRHAVYRPETAFTMAWLQAECPSTTSDQLNQALLQSDGWPITAKNHLASGEVSVFESCIKDLSQAMENNDAWLKTVDRWSKLGLADLDQRLGCFSVCLKELIMHPKEATFSSCMAVTAVDSLIRLEQDIQRLRADLQRGQCFLNLKMQIAGFLVDWRRLVINT